MVVENVHQFLLKGKNSPKEQMIKENVKQEKYLLRFLCVFIFDSLFVIQSIHRYIGSFCESNNKYNRNVHEKN